MTSAGDQPARLAVFVSGGGRTLANLLDRFGGPGSPARIELVVASRPCPAVGIAERAGVETRVIAGPIREADLLATLAERRIDWVVLAGYLRLLPVPPAYEGRIVNIHPALLPDFGGPGMYGLHVHRAVLASGAERSGCTVHLCDGAYDAGPILEQRECPVLPGDTPETLAARVFALELEAYPEVIARLAREGGPVRAGSGS